MKNITVKMAAAAAAVLAAGSINVWAGAVPEVVLPASYEEDTARRYPVIYLLPEDGADGVSEVVADAIMKTCDSPAAMDSILVKVDLKGSSPSTFREDMEKLVSEVDRDYRTVPEPGKRAVAGTGLGGYLASMLTYADGAGKLLKEPGLFGMVGGISPDYRAESPWRDTLGDFNEVLTGGPLSNAVCVRFFTFMRTAADEETAFEEGGANDVITRFIQKGAAYNGLFDAYYGNADDTVLDLVIARGADDDAFREQAAGEMAKGFSRRLMSELIEGEVSVSPQAAAADCEKVQVGYTLTLTDDYTAYIGAEEGEIELSFALINPSGEEPSASAGKTIRVTAGTSAEEAAETLPNLVEGEKAEIRLMAGLLGTEVALGSKPLVRIREGGSAAEEQFTDLMGLWKFQPLPAVTPGELPAAEEYEEWEEVIPALTWWDESFSKRTNMRAYVGYAWYVREFDLPSDYPEGKYVLPLGGFDETDMVWINGEFVGCTGLDEKTWQHLEDKWDTDRVYELDAGILNRGGKNVITVLTHNASGDGGWYAGHPTLYSEAAYEAHMAALAPSGEQRFQQVTIPSAKKAAALRTGGESEEESFLVYLPEAYGEAENADKRYPVVYLLHQLNSTSHSYVVDGIDGLLDEAIRDGRLDPLIVVIPDSAPESWWMGEWDDMVTEEIIPYVDANYRTLADAQHRFTAGASMGGHGALYIALSHPELFTGTASFFGAINMGANPLSMALHGDRDFLSHYRFYFIAGNRDLYKFGIPAVWLDRKLKEEGVAHVFELGEGGHDSAFYLPRFIDALAYITAENDNAE